MKKVILISGKMRSGKDQLCTYLIEELHRRGRTTYRTAYADRLKSQLLEDMAGVFTCLRAEHEKLMGNGVDPQTISWMMCYPEQFLSGSKTDFSRAMLQAYGTDILRKRAGQDYWVDQCLEGVTASTADYCFITDCRHLNEVERPREHLWENPVNSMEGTAVASIRVDRPGYARKGEASLHESETSLDDYDAWDYVVENEGTLDDLRNIAGTLATALEDNFANSGT